ncbi:MAG: aminopeptidase [Lachnospiraceae bacterium]|nr:aminopeptidase [Lachnospiraceae bacterium]
MAQKSGSAKVTAQKNNSLPKANAWLTYDDKKRKEVFALSENYKDFLSKHKTERECVKGAIKLAEAKGYKNLEDFIKSGTPLKPGDKVYHNNMGKALVLYIIGERPLEEGMKILGAHIDSPRLDLKQVPLYEKSEQGLLDTHYYGGIKKYQWVTIPLAFHGVVAKKDGSVIEINIGEKEDDPVFEVSDLLVHLSPKQLEKSGATVIEGEDLNILFGSEPLTGIDKEAVKANLLKLLKEKYDIENDDFLSAEIEAVPAGPARDLGLDRSMITGYGHDDRVCAYTSLIAMLETKKVDRTAACLLVDKEEIGSVGATGMHSFFFENSVAELVNLTGEYSELKVRRALANSHMLSSDVSAAYDANYPDAFEEKNAAFFGKGIVYNKYTGVKGKSGSNDANAEYMAKIRAAMDKNGVAFQTAELGKIDLGGGGTIAYIMAKYNMQVIDAGVPVLCMHSPWEIVSKSDVYEAKQAYIAFLKEV